MVSWKICLQQQMLSTHKCTATCDISNKAIFSSLFLTLPTEAASLLFQYNFMEMGLSPDTRLKKANCSCGDSRAVSSAYAVFLHLLQRWGRLQRSSRSVLDSSCNLFIPGWMALSVPTTKKNIPGMHNMKACFKWPKHSVPHPSIRKGDSQIWVT